MILTDGNAHFLCALWTCICRIVVEILSPAHSVLKKIHEDTVRSRSELRPHRVLCLFVRLVRDHNRHFRQGPVESIIDLLGQPNVLPRPSVDAPFSLQGITIFFWKIFQFLKLFFYFFEWFGFIISSFFGNKFFQLFPCTFWRIFISLIISLFFGRVYIFSRQSLVVVFFLKDFLKLFPSYFEGFLFCFIKSLFFWRVYMFFKFRK